MIIFDEGTTEHPGQTPPESTEGYSTADVLRQLTQQGEELTRRNEERNAANKERLDAMERIAKGSLPTNKKGQA